MRNLNSLLSFFLIGFTLVLYAQTDRPDEAKVYLKVLDNARDSLYKQIMHEFDSYLNTNQDDIIARLEQCKLIGQAFYDDYYEYNPLEKEFENCVSSLYNDFPDNHEVLFYILDNAWGDSAISVANQILDMNRSNPGSWSNQELSIVYKKLANTYQYNGTSEQVIESAELAQSLNDTIDLTYIIAQQYSDKGLYSEAINILLSKIDTKDQSQTLYDKARLLLELGEEKKALELFRIIERDTSLYVHNGKIAEALISNHKYLEARVYLLRDLSDSYNKSIALHNLFEYDYQHSPTDTLVATYERLMKEDFHNDTFGKYRFMLLFKAPFKAWKWNDLLKGFLFILLIILFIVLPYLYILPIDFISRRFNIKNEIPALQKSVWSLTDFWVISSIAFVIEIFVWMIYNYTDLLSTFFSDMYVLEESKISINQAQLAITYFLMMLIMTIGYLKKTDYQFLSSAHWKLGKSIGLGFLFALLFRMIYFALARNGVFPGFEVSMLSSIMNYLKSINQYYHPFLTFIFAVIIVPFYEEYIFRGILLNSIDRRIKFIAANMIQSVLFALVHDNTSLFLFYFLFGIIAGLLVKKSNSLLPALCFHSTNNLFAFIAILRM